MNETVGLIEIEPYDLAVGESDESSVDCTLDQLFARLVGRPAIETFAVTSSEREETILLSANLAALSADLEIATRGVLAQIFLSVGRR